MLVDDVITTGATASAYGARLAAVGGRVVGIVAVMKTEPSEPLLNPELYEDLDLED